MLFGYHSIATTDSDCLILTVPLVADSATTNTDSSTPQPRFGCHSLAATDTNCPTFTSPLNHNISAATYPPMITLGTSIGSEGVSREDAYVIYSTQMFEDDRTWIESSYTDIKQFVENLDTEESLQCRQVLLDQTQERYEADDKKNGMNTRMQEMKN